MGTFPEQGLGTPPTLFLGVISINRNDQKISPPENSGACAGLRIFLSLEFFMMATLKNTGLTNNKVDRSFF